MINGIKKNIKILILGSKGQLGQSLKASINYPTDSYKKKIENLRDLKSLYDKIKSNKFDIIINCIAFTNVNLAEKEKKLAYFTNSILPMHLSRFCKKNNIFFIHFSTDYVFNGKKINKYKETDKRLPVNYYGVTKLMGEKFIKQSKCNYIIFRVSALYSKKKKNNFLNKIHLINQLKKPFPIVSNQIVTPSSVELVAEIVNKTLSVISFKEKEIYHVAPKGSTSWYNFAKLYFAKKNIKNYSFPVSTKDLNFDVKRPSNTSLNSLKIEKKIKFRFKNYSYYLNRDFL